MAAIGPAPTMEGMGLNLTRLQHISSVNNARKQKQPKCPLTAECMNKYGTVTPHLMTYLFTSRSNIQPILQHGESPFSVYWSSGDPPSRTLAHSHSGLAFTTRSIHNHARLLIWFTNVCFIGYPQQYSEYSKMIIPDLHHCVVLCPTAFCCCLVNVFCTDRTTLF